MIRTINRMLNANKCGLKSLIDYKILCNYNNMHEAYYFMRKIIQCNSTCVISNFITNIIEIVIINLYIF